MAHSFLCDAYRIRKTLSGVAMSFEVRLMSEDFIQRK